MIAMMKIIIKSNMINTPDPETRNSPTFDSINTVLDQNIQLVMSCFKL